MEKLKDYLGLSGTSKSFLDLVFRSHLTLYDIWEILRDLLPPEEAYDAINKLARDFIRKEAREDIFILERTFIQKLEEVNLKNREAILNFLEWLINFCKEVSSFNANKALNVCERSGFLNVLRGGVFIKDNEIVERVESAYLEVITRANKLCEDIKNNRFINAYLHYTKILKASFELVALLSVESVKRLSKEAKTDPLTGLLNRRYMHLILKDVIELASITETPFTIALIDIDDFKKINDNYGHLVGDCVLKELAKLLKRAFRKGDYIFRYGGEEFLVVMPSTGLDEAVKVLERFRSIVERHTFRCDGKDLKITVSIGVCSDVPRNGKGVLSYVRCADIKLYKAKRSGKNRVVF
ncbi:GGDEF domain-containing protein [Aquifex sp.]